MKKLIAMLLALTMIFALAACGQKAPEAAPAPAADAAPAADSAPAAAAPAADENLTAVQKIIKEAEGMTMEELAKKAIEESNGKTL